MIHAAWCSIRTLGPRIFAFCTAGCASSPAFEPALMGGAETKERAADYSVQGRLEAAAQTGDAAAIRQLLTEGGKSSACFGGRIPLHLACARSAFRPDPAYLEALLADPSVDVNVPDKDGGTPMHMTLRASQHVQPRQLVNVLLAVRVLLRAGANVNARNQHGETPLHFGARVSKEVVQELLAAGADVSAVTDDGSNALAYASSVDMMRTLLAAGASPNTNSYGRSRKNAPVPLIVAATFHPEHFDLLLDAGADTAPLLHSWRRFNNVTNFSTVSLASASVVKKLLALGVERNARDDRGRTMLFRQPSPEVMHILLDAGIDVDAQDALGFTALHSQVEWIAATSKPPFLLVDALLEAGADVMIKSASGLTVLDVARRTGNQALIQHLRARCECTKLQ